MTRAAALFLLSSALLAQDKYMVTSPGQPSCPRITEEDSTVHPGSIADNRGNSPKLSMGTPGDAPPPAPGGQLREGTPIPESGNNRFTLTEVGKPRFIPMGQRPSVAAFGVADKAGKITTVADLKGRVVIIGFWTTACDASCRELMEMADLQPKGEKFGFNVLPVNFDPERWQKVMPFIQKNPKFFEKTQIFLPGIGAQGPAVLAKVIPALPAVFIVDRDGNLAYAGTGYESNVLVENLKKVLVEKKPAAN